LATRKVGVVVVHPKKKRARAKEGESVEEVVEKGEEEAEVGAKVKVEVEEKVRVGEERKRNNII
jgi:hypothetical protein